MNEALIERLQRSFNKRSLRWVVFWRIMLAVFVTMATVTWHT